MTITVTVTSANPNNNPALVRVHTADAEGNALREPYLIAVLDDGGQMTTWAEEGRREIAVVEGKRGVAYAVLTEAPDGAPTQAKPAASEAQTEKAIPVIGHETLEQDPGGLPAA